MEKKNLENEKIVKEFEKLKHQHSKKCTKFLKNQNKIIEENNMLKKRIYIGKREDVIDGKLSKYLNSYPERERLKILFLRESEGIYKFG